MMFTILVFVVFFSGCFLVALTGQNRRVGYWGIFWVSVFFSPVAGLIRGLVASPEYVPPSEQDPAGTAVSDMIIPMLSVAFVICYGYAIYDQLIK